MQDWELRDPRFEELDESDEEDGQGVSLDPYDGRRFVSDELFFDGHSRRGMYDQGRYGQDFDGQGYREQRGMAFQARVREKEEVLIQSALGRIARARAKGKTNVNLSEEEMEALQRRNNPQPEPPPALASPPPTPAKNGKGGKVGSRSNSSTSLANQKTRKRGSTGLFGNGSSSSPAKSNSKAKVNRKPSAEQQTPYPMNAPGMMVPGPDGMPVFAPIGYGGPPSPEYRRNNSGGSQPSSRSASKHSRRESTPPERTDPYAQYPMRYYPPHQQGMRPPSSSSNRSLPDDIDWYPPVNPRTRSASLAYDQDVPLALPAAQTQSPGRRNVSNPAYASPLRRTAAGSSPLASRPTPGYPSYSDPAITGHRGSGSGLRQQHGVADESSSGNEGSEDAGVQVDILPDEGFGGGYSISRSRDPAPVLVASSGDGGKRRRKGVRG
ncbi:uncharacterized protein LTR77_002338 [Saxophila tyrrhenica]|uniref:Uncharacterized protein n=1 Tax=Saxophila tyrrhenica TaxID=1690608 RepID=A0AAV9PIM4_9PEZI|nr:hypothetical protein LTR77_002338 [Saxophila tyrrhenica]